MGVDWIPCRVEAGFTREEMNELVRREAAHFRMHGFSIATTLDPRIRFSEAERAEIRRAYLELGPLHQRLLFKYASRRISVITTEELFPVEWRIDAERTILPWDLVDAYFSAVNHTKLDETPFLFQIGLIVVGVLVIVHGVRCLKQQRSG
jgi:hypothetical protein